jgi:hypothetical protein
MPGSCRWSLSFRFSYQKFVCISLLPRAHCISSSLILSCLRRLYKTWFGLTTGFIKHSYNTCLHFTVHCNTHTHTNLLSPGAVSPVVTSQRRCFLGSGPLDWSSHDDWSLTQLTQLTDFGSSSATSYIARERGCSYCCVTWCLPCYAHPLPSNCYVILVTRHTLLLCGRLATVVNKRHIACSMHVTSTVAWSPRNGCKHTPYCLQCARHNIIIIIIMITGEE